MSSVQNGKPRTSIVSTAEALQIFQDASRMLAQHGLQVKFARGENRIIVQVEGATVCQHCRSFKLLEQMNTNGQECLECAPQPIAGNVPA